MNKTQRSASPATQRSKSQCATALLFGLALLNTGCGDAENDLFDHTRQALAGELGEPCGESWPTGDYVDVNDASEECGLGMCLHGDVVASAGAEESVGMCSCRCDGPAGTGPFCACDSGFSCEHQIDDIGVGSLNLVGSYCIPND
jgi:hypothetical protein